MDVVYDDLDGVRVVRTAMRRLVDEGVTRYDERAMTSALAPHDPPKRRQSVGAGTSDRAFS